MGNYNSALLSETEEFVSIVSVTEKLNEQAAHAADERLQSELQTLGSTMSQTRLNLQIKLMEEERTEKQNKVLDSLPLDENLRKTHGDESALPAAEPKNVPKQPVSSLLPKVFSAVLHPASPPGPICGPPPSTNPPNLEQLQTELRDLRDNFEQMKSQHNKEIKLLMNELDEEKRIRLTLQMEIRHMKKHMSK